MERKVQTQIGNRWDFPTEIEFPTELTLKINWKIILT
jgi:hypothetical protein